MRSLIFTVPLILSSGVAMAQIPPMSQTAPTPTEQTDGVYQMVQEGVVREAQLHVSIAHLNTQIGTLTQQVKDLTAKLAVAEAKIPKAETPKP